VSRANCATSATALQPETGPFHMRAGAWQQNGTRRRQATFPVQQFLTGNLMRSILLWLIGIPLPIIILLWLFTGHA